MEIIIPSYRTFVHYGSDQFDPDLVKPVKNYWNKPHPGTCLWACPEDTDYGWKRWCIDNEFEHTDFTKSFRFQIDPIAKVWVLSSVKDFDTFP